MRKIDIRNIVGTGPLSSGICILVFLIFWKIEKYVGVTYLDRNKILQNILAIVLLCIGGVIFFAAIYVMPISKHNKYLVTNGAYSYVRHPRYAAIVFLVYPAFALLVHSLFCLLSTIVAYIIFRLLAVLEENKLIQVFGQSYKDYKKQTPAFIPKIDCWRFLLKKFKTTKKI